MCFNLNMSIFCSIGVNNNYNLQKLVWEKLSIWVKLWILLNMNDFPFIIKISKELVHERMHYINFQKINLVIILQGRIFEMMILFLDNSVYHSPEICSKIILFILIIEKSRIRKFQIYVQLPKPLFNYIWLSLFESVCLMQLIAQMLSRIL